MVRLNYGVRAGSFAFSFAVLALLGYERGYGEAFWILLVLQFLIYPHVLYWRACHSAHPRAAEEHNMFVDSALLGAWIAGMGFPLWIAYAALFSTTLNAAIVQSLRGAAISVICFIAGGLAAAVLLKPDYDPDTENLVTGLCFAGSFAYTCWIGYVSHKLRRRLVQRRAELQESEARYRLIAENAADLIALVDVHGRWLYASPSYEKMLAPEDLAKGSNIFRRMHPDDAEAAKTAVQRASSTGKPRELVLRFVDQEGRVRKLRTHIHTVEGEPAGRIMLVSQDVSELQESEEKLLLAAQAIEGMTEAIIIAAADGTVVTVNRSFTEITGLERDEVLGQNESATRNALQPPEFYDDIYAAVRRDGHWAGTTWSRRKSGAVYREWRSVRSVRDADGVITHFVTVFYEVGSGPGADTTQPLNLPLRA